MDTKKLRQKVLDLAIRGKLVSQDPNDEPAYVLLERIRNEKERLIEEGKIKRDKKEQITDKSHYEKVPFEVPEGWVWVKGFECFNSMENKKPTGKTFRYIDINSIDNKKHIITEAKDINVSDAPSRASRCVNVGDTLFSMVRPYLENIAYIDEEYDNCISSTGFFICKPNQILCPKFLYYLMLSSYVIDGLNAFMKGDNSPSINNENITTFLYPIPPIFEQQRIITIVETAFVLIDVIESNSFSLTQFIKQAKSKVLDIAIHGKLVPQDPNDEPASVLLERIKNEKKTEKPTTDNLHYPFEVPKNWVWIKLKDIFEINPRNNLNDEIDVSFIPMKLISDGFTNKHTSEIKKWQDVKKGFTHFRKGDVGIAKITPCFENRKSIMFQNLINDYGAGTTELHILRPKVEPFLSNYLIWFVKTECFIVNGVNCFTGAVGQQRIGKNIIEETPLPLPPLMEQKRIVYKIESIFQTLDSIQNNL